MTSAIDEWMVSVSLRCKWVEVSGSVWQIIFLILKQTKQQKKKITFKINACFSVEKQNKKNLVVLNNSHQ